MIVIQNTCKGIVGYGKSLVREAFSWWFFYKKENSVGKEIASGREPRDQIFGFNKTRVKNVIETSHLP